SVSWEAIPLVPMYTSSKYALHRLMRSLYPLMKRDAIGITCIDPVWADTQLLSIAARVVLLGPELLPVSHIAQTVLSIAADPDNITSGCSWLMPDNGPILRLQRENINEGTYKMINDMYHMIQNVCRLLLALRKDFVDLLQFGTGCQIDHETSLAHLQERDHTIHGSSGSSFVGDNIWSENLALNLLPFVELWASKSHL
ncbi:hypothetical protein DFH08DRAFT_686193, partial [Mycena albidolilacea]